jgi:hypothetical protein
MPSLPNSELLPKSQVFQKQVATSAERSDDQNCKKPQQAKHEGIFARGWPKFICLIRWQIGILANQLLREANLNEAMGAPRPMRLDVLYKRQ